MKDKKKRFCKEYIKDLNGAQAATRAGYSERTAKQKAYELLNEDEVAEYITKLKNGLDDEYEEIRKRIVEEWQKLAFTDITHLHNTWIKLKKFESLTDKQRACIETIDSKTETQYKGTKKINIKYIKIKLHSKTKALEELGKITGIYEKDNKQKKNEIPIPVIIFKKSE